METLKEKTARGLFWGGMNTIVQQVIGLLFGIILGRLLAPSDYGMMAIISVFALVATALQDSGFKVALANEKAPTHAGYNAVFWFNILMGIALYAALFLSAPLIGRWYNTPQVVPLWHYSPWRPSVRGITFAPVRRMFRFSCKILASTVTTHINNNVLNILLGHYFSTADAGNFNQAYQWNFKCYSLIQNMVGPVAQPVPPVPAPPRRPVTPHQHAPAAGAAPSGASSTPSSSHGTARSLTWSRGEISI